MDEARRTVAELHCVPSVLDIANNREGIAFVKCGNNRRGSGRLTADPDIGTGGVPGAGGNRLGKRDIISMDEAGRTVAEPHRVPSVLDVANNREGIASVECGNNCRGSGRLATDPDVGTGGVPGAGGNRRHDLLFNDFDIVGTDKSIFSIFQLDPIPSV